MTSFGIRNEYGEKGLVLGHFKKPNGLLALDARERLKKLAERVAGLYEVEKRLDGHTGSRKTRGAVHDFLINRNNAGQRRSLLGGHSFRVMPRSLVLQATLNL